MELVRWGFRDAGITRDADLPTSMKNHPSPICNLQSQGSFRAHCKKSDLKSAVFYADFFPPFSENPAVNVTTCKPSNDFDLRPASFLTPHQWAILDPLLPSPNSPPPSGEGPGVRSPGCPPTDPHALIEAIFWKFAHHARWKDLPAGSPPMLTCRRYYRRLFLSGRLATLYAALYKDFLASGQSDLTVLIDRGGIINTGKELVLTDDVPETWQMRTAMLFLQPAYQSYCRLLREKEQEFRSPDVVKTL